MKSDNDMIHLLQSYNHCLDYKNERSGFSNTKRSCSKCSIILLTLVSVQITYSTYIILYMYCESEFEPQSESECVCVCVHLAVACQFKQF